MGLIENTAGYMMQGYQYNEIGSPHDINQIIIIIIIIKLKNKK
jgi:hypothetical protein